MRQLKYNSASNVLRFEFPVEWKGEDITGVTLTIVDRDGNELLAADALTLYTATELDGAVAQYQGEVTLDSGAGNLSQGDPILIAGAAGAERHIVGGYNATSKVVTLEDNLNSAHEDADAVYGLWGEITVDTTVVATFTTGLVCTLLWTPTGSGQATTQAAQISKAVVELEGLGKRLNRYCSRAYNAFTRPDDYLSEIQEEAERRIGKKLLVSNVDLNRMVDQDIVADAVLAEMCRLWTISGDKDMEDERKFFTAEVESEMAIILALPIWIDQNQDLIEDKKEIDLHIPTFGRGY